MLTDLHQLVTKGPGGGRREADRVAEERAAQRWDETFMKGIPWPVAEWRDLGLQVRGGQFIKN